MSSFMQQRRPTKPADRFTAPMEERSSRTVLSRPDAESATTDQSVSAPRDLATLRRPLTPIPLFRLDVHATTAPAPQRKETPASMIQQPASSAARETPSSEQAEEGSMAREAVDGPIRGIVQARVTVKHIGSGIAPISPNAACPPPAQRKNLTGLPDGLKEGTEALSGVTLDDVRVHYNSMKPATVQAFAYAQGTEIHVGPGQEQHLPHEAWHVVQQKQGRVQPTLIAKGLPVNNDVRLEREADRMGERALSAPQRPAVRAESNSRLGGGVPPATSPLSSPSGTVIQRLMSLAVFKETSKSDYTVRYFSSVNVIDTALAAYHALPKENFLGRERQLHALEDACENYLDAAADNDARRLGIRALRAQTRNELSYIELLADATRAPSRGSKMTALMDALDLYVRTLNRGVPPYDAQWDIRVVITDRILRTANAMTEEERQAVLVHDLGKLEALGRDMTLPEITRRVIAEVTAHAPSVHFAHSTPGATLSKPNIAEKYTVNHWLPQTGGTAERLGSLAHELTHVSISETFKNTSLFLAFAPGSSDDEIRALVATRTAATKDLQDLLDADESFKHDQTSLLQSKINYAKGNKLGHYAATFQEAKKITPETGAEIRRLAGIANNAVIEYDTVINQMLVYMALWRIPTDNPFYTRLRAVATEAYQHRLAHRGR